MVQLNLRKQWPLRRAIFSRLACALSAIFICTGIIRAQERLVDSLKQELNRPKKDTATAKLLSAIGQAYADLSSFDSAESYFNRSFELNRKIGNDVAAFSVLNLMGVNEYYRGNNQKAKKLWKQCLDAARQGRDKAREMDLLQNLANIEMAEGRYAEALKINLDCLKYAESQKDSSGTRSARINIGIVYSLMTDYENATKYFLAAEKAFPPGAKSVHYLLCLTNIGQCYLDMRQFDQAEAYFRKAMTAGRAAGHLETEVASLGGLGVVLKEEGKYPDAAQMLQSAIKLGMTLGDDRGRAIDMERLAAVYVLALENGREGQIQNTFGPNRKSALLSARKLVTEALDILKEENEIENIRAAHLTLSNIEKLLGNYESALEHLSAYSTLSDSLFSRDKNTKLAQVSLRYEFERKEAANRAAQEKKDIRAGLIRNSFAAGLTGALIFLAALYRQRNKIRSGKQRSDELLLNILPGEVAEELKETGTAAARQYEQVTVMFTDFKGFTKIAERLSPTELVAELDACFRAFDHIIENHKIEKIKTIGDAYMCVGGLPVPNKTHAKDVVMAALEIKAYMLAHSEKRRQEGREVFEIRIGVHSGPVVAGIVGVKKFAYDIWGDTVNTASRLESSGETGEVNISGSTYQLVKDEFNCTYRGKITAKHKGEIDMYFVS